MVKVEEPRPDGTTSSGETEIKVKKKVKEPTLHEKLADLISSINLKDKKNPHEIIKGLDQQGITTWEDFVLMERKDINFYFQPAASANLYFALPIL